MPALMQEHVHAARPDQWQQRSAKDQAVESGQRGSDGRAITCYEGIHNGVLLDTQVCSQLPRTPRNGAVSTLGCGRQPALGY